MQTTQAGTQRGPATFDVDPGGGDPKRPGVGPEARSPPPVPDLPFALRASVDWQALVPGADGRRLRRVQGAPRWRHLRWADAHWSRASTPADTLLAFLYDEWPSHRVSSGCEQSFMTCYSRDTTCKWTTTCSRLCSRLQMTLLRSSHASPPSTDSLAV